MPKKASKKASKQPTVDQVAIVARLAKELGVHPNTLNSAIQVGTVDSVTLHCGSTVAVVSSAKAWAKSPRKRGRPKGNQAD